MDTQCAGSVAGVAQGPRGAVYPYMETIKMTGR